MNEENSYKYDVFISYRWITPDEEWVREQLYPALKNAGLRVCLDVEDFVPGRNLMLEMERAGNEARHVLCIITPEYFEEGRMVEFENLSAQIEDPAGRNSSLIPVILRETNLPKRVRPIIPINWSKPNDHRREWRKLLQVLGASENTASSPPGAVQAKEKDEDTVQPQQSDKEEVEELDEEDWEILIDRINERKCTPIIGPGIYDESFSFQSLIDDWSRNPEYPFSNLGDLTLAAQFRSVYWDSIDPKSKIIKKLQEFGPPNFSNYKEPHSFLASLPFCNYLTTNFDDFIFKALEFQKKQPRRDLCRWDDPQNCEKLSVFKSGYDPDVMNPIVFHLFGYSLNKRGLVLTEDDYLDFLANVSRYPALIPPKIQEALTNSSVLLLGYRLDDWNFRILFRTLVNYLKNSPYKVHISVQISPIGKNTSLTQIKKAKNYFKRYLINHNIRVSWKSCPQFIEELKTRWDQSGYANSKINV